MSLVKTIRSWVKIVDPHKYPYSIHLDCPDNARVWLENMQCVHYCAKKRLRTIFTKQLTVTILQPWNEIKKSNLSLLSYIHHVSPQKLISCKRIQLRFGYDDAQTVLKPILQKRAKSIPPLMLQSFQENLSLNQQAINTFNLCDWMCRRVSRPHLFH